MFKRLIRPTFTIPDTPEGRLFFRLLSFFLNRERYELKWQFQDSEKNKGKAVYIVEKKGKHDVRERGV